MSLLLELPIPRTPVPGPVRALALACALAACGAHGSETALAGPLRAPAAAVDFGPTWEGTILRHSFQLEVGSEPLRILETETDCGCTLTRLQGVGGPYELGEELAPGTPLELDVEVHTRGQRGRTPRKVRLLWQEAGGPPRRSELTVHADVRPWLVAEPPPGAPLVTREGRAVEASFVVRQLEGEPFGLRASSKGLPPWVEVRVDPGTRSARHEVGVRVTGAAPRGIRGYGVTLQSDRENPAGFVDPGTGEPACFSLLREISVEVRGPVGLRPPSLSFGAVRPGQVVSRTVRVESHDPDFELAEPRAVLAPLKRDEPFYLADSASIRARAAGEGAWDVEVTLDGLDERIRGNFFARLVIETGHPDLPELEASLMGIALDPGGAARAAGGGG